MKDMKKVKGELASMDDPGSESFTKACKYRESAPPLHVFMFLLSMPSPQSC